MARTLGDPGQDYVILGEGNVSARESDKSFWVKASGTAMNGITEDGFVEVWQEPVLAMLRASQSSDSQVKEVLETAKVLPQSRLRPSVETTFHAVALTEGEAKYVGHTHPTALNGILCSNRAREAFGGRLFPDEIVICGPAPAFVAFTDPGLPLALAIQQEIRRYKVQYKRAPKVILLQNHGLIALGQTDMEVLQITAMMNKTARVILGAYTVGEPNFLSQDAVQRIDTRPDEQFRRDVLAR